MSDEINEQVAIWDAAINKGRKSSDTLRDLIELIYKTNYLGSNRDLVKDNCNGQLRCMKCVYCAIKLYINTRGQEDISNTLPTYYDIHRKEIKENDILKVPGGVTEWVVLKCQEHGYDKSFPYWMICPIDDIDSWKTESHGLLKMGHKFEIIGKLDRLYWRIYE